MPTKKDYLGASEILGIVAKERLRIQDCFMLFLPFESRKRYMNMLLQRNFNWGSAEVEQWQRFLKSYELSKQVNWSTPREIKRYKNHSEYLHKMGLLQGIIDKILETPYISNLGRPSLMAAHFDYLFISEEPNYEIRHPRLVNIFSSKQKIEDEKWVKVLYDMSRERNMFLKSQQVLSKYK